MAVGVVVVGEKVGEIQEDDLDRQRRQLLPMEDLQNLLQLEKENLRMEKL